MRSSSVFVQIDQPPYTDFYFPFYVVVLVVRTYACEAARHSESQSKGTQHLEGRVGYIIKRHIQASKQGKEGSFLSRHLATIL